jgi:hypothetical protein
MQKEHPLLDELWKIREVDLKAIDVPAFIVPTLKSSQKARLPSVPLISCPPFAFPVPAPARLSTVTEICFGGR